MTAAPFTQYHIKNCGAPTSGVTAFMGSIVLSGNTHTRLHPSATIAPEIKVAASAPVIVGAEYQSGYVRHGKADE